MSISLILTKAVQISAYSTSKLLLLGILIFANGEGLAQGSTSSPANPVIWADVPDPSVVRVGEIYYMSSTTMHMNPGVPVMKSDDLINWQIVSYAYDTLTVSDAYLLNNGQNAYGDGSWASSLKYHDGMFYLATFSYTTGSTYIFQTENIEEGSWTRFTINSVYHDPSLIFDEGRAFLVYGRDDIRIIELNADATTVKDGGVNQILIPDADGIVGDDFIVPAEGPHIQKIGDHYFVSLITWPSGSMRTQLIYRADSLLGDYTGRVALQYNGVAQGGLIDTPEGDWYAFLFRDRGSVGRIPYLVPVSWEDDWPVLGNNGQVPGNLDIDAEYRGMTGVVDSDEFNSALEEGENAELPLVWQWNHNPVDEYWSLTERPGYLRIKNGELDSGFLNTKNTITQRTFGPVSTGTVLVDVSRMKFGDYAGLGALQENYGFIGVKMSGSGKSLIMATGNSESMNERESVELEQDSVFLKVSFDFKNQIDRAYFYYSLDGNNWSRLGSRLQMSYSIPHFMGYRFALFNYATNLDGGYVDFDYFRVEDTLFDPNTTSINHIEQSIPEEFKVYDNYPNPFNPSTKITYSIPVASVVSVNVYDVKGQLVRNLVNARKAAGQHTVNFDAKELATGIYFYEVNTGSFKQVRKMTLIK